MAGRLCADCDKPLYPHEQGTLCSPCLYAYICDPAPDAGGQTPGAGNAHPVKDGGTGDPERTGRPRR